MEGQGVREEQGDGGIKRVESSTVTGKRELVKYEK